MKRVLYVVSEDWAFVSHRLHIAKVATKLGYQIGVIARVTDKADQIEDVGVKMFSWELHRGSLNPFNAVRAILRTLDVMFKFQPDIIHVIALKPIMIVGFAAFFFKKVPILFEFGGVGFVFTAKSAKISLLKILLCFLLRFLLKGKRKHIIIQNEDDKNLLEAAKLFSPEKVFLVPGAGVERDLYQPIKIPEWSGSSPPIVALPARLLWDKGVGEFIRLAASAKKRGFKARFVLLGEPDMENHEAVSRSDIIKWVESGVVEWWGRMENMPLIYPKVSIVCFPSYREGIPKALLETASCARPIVCFDVPGCRDVVEHQINGFLVPFGNEAELLNRVCQLLSDYELTTRMGIAGSEITAIKFDSGIIARQVTNIWDRVST